MIVYNPTDEQHGLLLAQVWARAKTDGDLPHMLTAQGQSLPRFFKRLEYPTVVVFDTDEQGVWLLAWFEPLFDFAYCNLWIRRDRRNREALPTVHQVYESAFKIWPTLLGFTKQERLLKSHAKLGYRMVGKLERLFDGEDAWLVQLTKDDFEAKRGAAQ